MNRLFPAQRTAVVRCLVEGNSIRATVRLTGVAKNTVTKLLVNLGAACSEYQDRVLRDLPCRRIQADEIWSFCNSKAKNVPAEHQGEFGWSDVWTWTTIDADTKLVPCWLIGDRSAATAIELMDDLRVRLANRVQLTTDGHRAYLEAVEGAFGSNIDYAQIIKLYGNDPEPDKRYSPAKCLRVEVHRISGNPRSADVSTGYVERQNLTMRMGMRRFTRLTNAFSRKVENLAAAVSLHFMYYKFARPHKTLANPYPRTQPWLPGWRITSGGSRRSSRSWRRLAAMPEQPERISYDLNPADDAGGGVTDARGQGSILADFVDYLMPLLRPYETTIYLYLLRRTILRGERETKVGLRTISKDCGVGTRSASGGNIQHIREVLGALEAKGCIAIGERTRDGTAVTVSTPSQVPGVADRMAEACIPPAPPDYYRDPELRTGLFERDGWACHYCGDVLTSATATLDHLIPVTAGGANTAENLVTCCLLCNSVKAGRSYEEAAALLLDSIRLRRKRSTPN